jgi:hypothetical protein
LTIAPLGSSIVAVIRPARERALRYAERQYEHFDEVRFYH